jgi:DNA polymerase-3 subunit beta
MVILDKTVIYSRLIEGKYPHYESVIPQNNEEKLIVSNDNLTKVVKRIMIFANPISHQVVFNISKDSLEISAEDIELGGQGREKIAAKYEGEDKTIGYNAVYVLELLKQIHTDEVLFLLGGATQAGIVKPVEQKEGEDFIMLIMPVRLN